MSSSQPSLCLIVPAYNAEQTLSQMIERIPELVWERTINVFVVNDGSTDSTASVVSDLAKSNPKILLVSLPENQGYGAAVRAGLQSCQPSDPDYCVCLHADGQYPPEKIPGFIEFMVQNRVDILQGSRHKDGMALKGNMPLYKYVFGKILTEIENAAFGLSMTDYHSGFLFYSRAARENIPFSKLSSSFEFDLEVIASAHARGMSVEELGIPTHYGDEKSYLNPINYGFRVLRVVFKYIFGAYGRSG